MTTATQILTTARAEIGYRESAGDRTKYGAWYGMNGTAWCAIFVSWVAGHTPGGTEIIPRHAYTPAGADWFKARGQWHTTPKVGDLVYFNFPGDGVNRISHVGLVEKVNADGSITTIEGNTNAAGSRTGGGVWRKVRSVGIVGYGRPKYTKPPVSAAAKPITELSSSTKMGKYGWQVSDMRWVLYKAGFLDRRYLPANVKNPNVYDANVQAAVKRFHESDRGKKYRGSGDIRQIGPQGWKAVQYLAGRR